MTGWRVSTTTPHHNTYWLGTQDKPELICITILPCHETRHEHERVKALAAALNTFDWAQDQPQGDPDGYLDARGVVGGTEPAEHIIRRMRGEDEPPAPTHHTGAADRRALHRLPTYKGWTA